MKPGEKIPDPRDRPQGTSTDMPSELEPESLAGFVEWAQKFGVWRTVQPAVEQYRRMLKQQGRG